MKSLQATVSEAATWCNYPIARNVTCSVASCCRAISLRRKHLTAHLPGFAPNNIITLDFKILMLVFLVNWLFFPDFS